MENSEQVKILRQGRNVWDEWRKQHPTISPDLSGADLHGIDLSEAILSGTDLHRANLRGTNLSRSNLFRSNLSEADLSEANLRDANLSRSGLGRANLNGTNLSRTGMNRVYLGEADLSNADLYSADLSEANLRNANLWKADLHLTNLRHANLSGTNLQNAVMYSTIFAYVDLRLTRGLTGINHQGPSNIELYTIQLPQDGSARHFLRDAGVPDEWIDFYRATMMNPIQYHSCFISYTHQDEPLASRLYEDLQTREVPCWFVPKDMKIGDEIRSRIDEEIHSQEKLLLLLSMHSLNSGWVRDEVEAAYDKENQQKYLMLFPIRLDESVMETTISWAVKLRRQRHIGDFTGWKDHNQYQVAFDRLLRDLKKADEPPAETGNISETTL